MWSPGWRFRCWENQTSDPADKGISVTVFYLQDFIVRAQQASIISSIPPLPDPSDSPLITADTCCCRPSPLSLIVSWTSDKLLRKTLSSPFASQCLYLSVRSLCANDKPVERSTITKLKSLNPVCVSNLSCTYRGGLSLRKTICATWSGLF